MHVEALVIERASWQRDRVHREVVEMFAEVPAVSVPVGWAVVAVAVAVAVVANIVPVVEETWK